MNTPIFIPMTVSADTASIPMTVSANAVELSVTLGVMISASTAPDYDGPYTVTPKAEAEQILPTMGKTMTDDVTVYRIPYFQTSNLYGDTVYIAADDMHSDKVGTGKVGYMVLKE